ncbi:MAG: precorrin methylase [Confluentimicrobium sp.]|mgnify:CR=1 FL=1|jgi:cobalt-precorrin 5A hydrolase|uniref:cobalamin biosynthesis protein n=1 Tax=Actibacterium sp. TaxID=1872125 RepID=UPI000C55F707|nr:cobalamin biosynthesis protein [Actibacterium sp.]MBC56677.1 precorrin methylase [Actibacterium sp.]|tara:strand:+ start:521 stop:883 length:363 start_codon:yes stop_codon:yes gene_type:complete
MRVAGIGFRTDAPVAALREAVDRAGGRADALATAADKATAPALVALAEALCLPVLSVLPAQLARQTTLSRSPRVEALFGTGSLAEAAALAAAGPGARLIGPRVQSADGMATAAIAEGPQT